MDGLTQQDSRIEREQRTVEALIMLYCRGRHTTEEALCEECEALLTYAWNRLDQCPWGEAKPTCAKCSVHCYRPVEREQVRRAMRYAGPRMVLHRPWLAIMHLLDGLRGSTPPRPERARASDHQAGKQPTRNEP